MIHADYGNHLCRVVDRDTERREQEAQRNDEVEVDVFSAWHVYRVISETITYWQSNEFKMASKHWLDIVEQMVSTVKLLVGIKTQSPPDRCFAGGGEHSFRAARRW